MGGPRTSSDILGIEVGRDALRGVLLDHASTELTAAAEHPLAADAVNFDGIIDPLLVGPALEELLTELGVYDRSQFRVGLSVGPRNSGVGSGPAMVGWLESQAASMREPLRCSGGLGVAFTPSRAVDAVVKLASDAGIDLARIDLAPVAAARAIGDQVEDVICVGSGQGWQARMRDFEVLEAMENGSVESDAPLHLVAADGQVRSISRYGWVEIAGDLEGITAADLGQLAIAAGTAIGVAYESPTDLLSGKTVGCLVNKAATVGSLDNMAAVELVDGAESTLRLQPRESAGDVEGQRTPRQTPTTSLSPLRRPSAPEEDAGVPAPMSASDRQQLASAAEPLHSDEPLGAVELDGGEELDEASAEEATAAWDDSLHVADPITMFSPDTEVEQMMGKRDRRLSVDIFIGLLVLSLIALGVVYFYL